MMELGALCCLPREPLCAECPVARSCRARAEGATDSIPVRALRPAKRRNTWLCGAVERRGRLLLVCRPAGTLLAGTWVLPLLRNACGRGGSRAARRALAGLGLRVEGSPTPVGAVRHIFTHRDATAVGVAPAPAASQPPRRARWVRDEELAFLPLSTFGRKMTSPAPRVN